MGLSGRVGARWRVSEEMVGGKHAHPTAASALSCARAPGGCMIESERGNGGWEQWPAVLQHSHPTAEAI